jgi:hypothetical protein|tara:strand:+ start:12308 stop:13084 length:777 start_codon:yes stop_codon:yes gene_type:complete
MNKQAAAILTIVCLAPLAFAHDDHGQHCSVRMGHDVEVSPDAIRISDGEQVLVQIVGDDRLYILGDEVDLDSGQEDLVSAYSNGIRSTLPVVADVILEGVEIGLTVVSKVFHGMTGSEPPSGVADAMKNIRRRAATRLKVEGAGVSIREGHLHHLDDVVDELKPEFEDAIAASIGSLVMAVGRAIMQGDGDLLERIEDFSYRMEDMGSEIEEEIGDRGDELDRKAEQMCEEMQALDDVERDVQTQIPALRRYDLITVD